MGTCYGLFRSWDGDAIALFLDRTNQKIVRLHQGETHAGWVLSSVQGREVMRQRFTPLTSAKRSFSWNGTSASAVFA